MKGKTEEKKIPSDFEIKNKRAITDLFWGYCLEAQIHHKVLKQTFFFPIMVIKASFSFQLSLSKENKRLSVSHFELCKFFFSILLKFFLLPPFFFGH